MANNNKAKVAAGSLVLASASLLAFLSHWEGDDRTVYADKLAGGLPTACGGITKHTSPYPVVVGDVWSQARCDELLAIVAKRGQLRLLDCVTGEVTQGAFNALSSHEHNFGTTATCGSRAVGLINAGRLADGCRALSHDEQGRPVWSSVRTGKLLPDGTPEYKFVQGLYNRRKAETAMCLKGT